MRKLFMSTAFVLAVLPAGVAMALEPSADQRYCAALSQLYGRYVGSTEFGPNSFLPRDVEARYALYKCEQGDALVAIPILENRLKNARVELPPRS
jgi:hypothetical protein